MAQAQKQELKKKKNNNNSTAEEIEEFREASSSSSPLSTTATSTIPCLDDGKMENGNMVMGKKYWRWEKKRKKKKKKKKKKESDGFLTEDEDEEEDEDDENRQDPLEVFGLDIMMMILTHLDARSVAQSLLVSRRWHGVASSDRLWASKCEELWLGKAHIPRMSQVRGLSKLAAYSISVMDGKRTRIMKDDLCDHVWEFHFNKGAPEYWRNLDPYWKGTGPPMRRYFHPDGSQSADGVDKVWGGHECSYSIVTSIIGDGRIRQHYVRINRWPQMHVSRKPDWSWEMFNQLYSYSSIPDADKEGGTGPVYPLF